MISRPRAYSYVKTEHSCVGSLVDCGSTNTLSTEGNVSRIQEVGRRGQRSSCPDSEVPVKAGSVARPSLRAILVPHAVADREWNPGIQ